MSTEQNKGVDDTERSEPRATRRDNPIIEIYIWMCLSTLPVLQPVLTAVLRREPPIYLLIENFTDVISSFLIFSVPFFFKQIFGILPLQYLRSTVDRRRENINISQIEELQPKTNNQTLINVSLKNADLEARSSGLLDNVDLRMARSRVSEYNSHQLLSLYALESAKSAQRIQARAGIFLIVGVVVAFVGLAFFYYYHSISDVNGAFTDRILAVVPGFGILFFVEFIALFFLRQYRLNMDEYRYYEGIARKREETLLALKIIYESGDKLSAKESVDLAQIFWTLAKLGKDETTDLIETRKLQKDDIVIIERFADMLSSVRSGGITDKVNTRKE